MAAISLINAAAGTANISYAGQIKPNNPLSLPQPTGQPKISQAVKLNISAEALSLSSAAVINKTNITVAAALTLANTVTGITIRDTSSQIALNLNKLQDMATRVTSELLSI